MKSHCEELSKYLKPQYVRHAFAQRRVFFVIGNWCHAVDVALHCCGLLAGIVVWKSGHARGGVGFCCNRHNAAVEAMLAVLVAPVFIAAARNARYAAVFFLAAAVVVLAVVAFAPVAGF